jgi:hypothetical protein
MTPDAFETLKQTLGVSGEGDRVRVPIDDVDGVVDYFAPNFLGIRSDQALYRFFGRNAFGGPVGMSIHHFADGVDADAAGAEWTRWLAGVYA